MTYLHTDDRLNAREEPTVRERELLDAIDGVLAEADPPGIVQDEALWYLGTALEGQSNLEITMSISWDRDIALRVLLTEDSFSMGWGGDLGEPFTFESFRSHALSIEELKAAFMREMSRDIRVSRRRRLLGGTAEFHIRHEGVWIDLLRGGVSSKDKALGGAVREVTLLT